METQKELLKHFYTDEDKLRFSAELAQKHHELDEKEKDKKDIVKRMDADLAAIEASIRSLATKIRDGYELRPTECEVIYNYAAKEKTIYRTDTGEIVRVESLTPEEMQTGLDLGTK